MQEQEMSRSDLIAQAVVVLDKRFPGWWRNINTGPQFMTSVDNCVLGQNGMRYGRSEVADVFGHLCDAFIVCLPEDSATKLGMTKRAFAVHREFDQRHCDIWCAEIAKRCATDAVLASVETPLQVPTPLTPIEECTEALGFASPSSDSETEACTSVASPECVEGVLQEVGA